eukprot:gb/GECG01015959.1/.p1 GENE.gb/GECG01015959.1/~~gb/GECG01015959.1/.p1  ORF type:complete len:122 (+),score=20.12 gb/GECG01015959.1/:1-366(+)
MEGAKVSVVSIPVSDQQAAKRFYTEVLKFEIVREDAMDESSSWIQLRPTGSSTTFTLVAWFDKMPPGSMQGLVLGVENLDQAVKDLRENGVEVSDPKEQHWGTFSMFSDPDGNSIVLTKAQ